MTVRQPLSVAPRCRPVQADLAGYAPMLVHPGTEARVGQTPTGCSKTWCNYRVHPIRLLLSLIHNSRDVLDMGGGGIMRGDGIYRQREGPNPSRTKPTRSEDGSLRCLWCKHVDTAWRAYLDTSCNSPNATHLHWPGLLGRGPTLQHLRSHTGIQSSYVGAQRSARLSTSRFWSVGDGRRLGLSSDITFAPAFACNRLPYSARVAHV
jgi:hypothetical protein